MSIENKLDRYIDALNGERRPKEHKGGIKNDEYSKLSAAVRMVRLQREVEYPDEKYEKALIDSLLRKPGKKMIMKRAIALTATVVAAAFLLFAITDAFPARNNNSIVYAMEKAIEAMKAYHGIIEYTEINQLGETMTQSRKEVWADKQGNYYVKELGGFSEGTITANNGDIKWQLRPSEQSVYTFQPFPDSYRFTFELGSEIDDIRKALTIKEVGQETISGRDSIILEVTPDAGEPYRLWIDKENNLPLQRESAMQNALRYKVSYSFIEFVDAVPEKLMSYVLPGGYMEVDNNPEQIVSSLEEAQEMTGLQSVIPNNIPEGYQLDKIVTVKDLPGIKLYYNKEDSLTTVVISQSKQAGELKPDMNAILGDINGNRAEILNNGLTISIRWQQQGVEYSVLGNDDQEIIKAFTQSIADGEVNIGSKDNSIVGKPQIEVPVDLTVEENEQKSVDAGHSPWKLDPAFVTQVFASLLLSPEGITGDYPIPYEAIQIIENNGVEAKAVINDVKSIARIVYLRRLVRQDDSGIWTVVGYDTDRD